MNFMVIIVRLDNRFTEVNSSAHLREKSLDDIILYVNILFGDILMDNT